MVLFMIPKWIYSLMVKNRLSSGMQRDEHNEPIDEPLPERSRRLASPGWGDNYDPKKDTGKHYKLKKRIGKF